MAYESPIGIKKNQPPRTGKLTDDQVRAIRIQAAALKAAGHRFIASRLAVEFDVSEATVSAIVRHTRKAGVAD